MRERAQPKHDKGVVLVAKLGGHKEETGLEDAHGVRRRHSVKVVDLDGADVVLFPGQSRLVDVAVLALEQDKEQVLEKR